MSRKPSIGSWISLGHPSIAEVMADAGFDWLCIDIEHSVVDYLEAQQLITAIQGRGKKAFVRVGENNPRIIKRVLDAGAEGIIVPMVNTAEDAKRAVQSVRYPPLGKRGVGLARAQGYGFGFEPYLEKSKTIPLVVQIEHIDAIKNLESILATEGIDGSLIGPYDLSGSMGKPGRFDDADVKEALSRYEEISQRMGKKMGFHVIQPDYRLLQEKIDKGYEFIAFSMDILFLGSLCREQLSHIRKK